MAEKNLKGIWIAREMLSIGHRPSKSGTKVPLNNWTQYCEDIYN